MLKLIVGQAELFNDETQEFIKEGGTELQLEHSLVSISKWESKWEKPFLATNNKTSEMSIDYIKMMNLSPEIPPEVFDQLTNENVLAVSEYIEAKMTATWFGAEPKNAKPNREIITAEVIYYWMIALSIPVEFETWHLNRLLTLIKVCNQKNAPEKKMSRAELIARNQRLNAERKESLKTKG